MKKFLFLISIVWGFILIQGVFAFPDNLQGIGFEKKEVLNSKFWVMKVDLGEGVIKVEDKKFNIKLRKSGSSSKKVFDIFTNTSINNKFMDKKLKFKNVNVGILILESLKDAPDKYFGFLQFKKTLPKSTFPAKIYVVFWENKERK